jgi:hypothetical protein
MHSHRSFPVSIRAILFLLALSIAATACDDTSLSTGQTKWIIKPGAMSLAVLVSDYLSYSFEMAALDYYPTCDGCDDAGLPFSIRLRAPYDFGDITFEYTATGDTLFYGTIIWLGTGGIGYPREFTPAGEFESAADPPEDPASIEYFNITPQMDDEIFKARADSAWQEVRDLDIVGEFAKGQYRAGIYLYAPAVGVFDPGAARWIIFLERQKPLPMQ